MANAAAAPRCVALIGPYLSGKTSLLEAMLFTSGTTTRHGSVRDGNSIGDHSPEARARQMSTELNVAHASFLGDPWTILDCPGSVELLYEAEAAVLASDIAVVVCEPEVERALTVSPLLRFLERHDIPHMIFINKLDTSAVRVRSCWRRCSRCRDGRWCCGRCRCAMPRAGSPDMSISSASAPIATGRVTLPS